MNTKALRQKILDLAIHGKLVPQDPNDEPASVLLERIRTEKERLIKEGKIKKPKKSKAACDKPHYPFELPKGWEWTTLGEIFTLQAGKNITSNNISPTQNAEYKYPCFGGNGIRGYVASSNRSGNYPIIGRQGALCGNVNLANGEFYATEHAVVVDYYCETDFMWCYYTLEALNLNQYATATAQPGLAVNIINEVSIPLPPYKEQKVISEAISYWLSLIDTIGNSKEQLLIAIGQAKSQILDLAIHGKLVPQDPNDEPASELLKRINPKAVITCDNPQYGKLPKGWCETTLKSLAKEVFAGGDKPTEFTKEKTNGNIIPIYANGVEKDGLYGYTNAARVIEPCLTVSARGTIGFTCIRNIPFVPIVRLITIVPNPAFDLKYMKFCLDCLLIWSEGSSIPQLTVPTIKKMQLPLPPLQEQHRIVAKIEELFTQFDKIEEGVS